MSNDEDDDESSESNRTTSKLATTTTRKQHDDSNESSIKTESQAKSGTKKKSSKQRKDSSTDDEIETASEIRDNEDEVSSIVSRGSRSKPTITNKSSRRLSFENDSFKKFTSEMFDKYMHEEAMRSRHQAHLLKLRERALIEKTNAELAWLEQMKKKALDKGQDDRMPSMIAKEKGIMSKLKREQANIDRLKAVQRKEAQNRLGVLAQHAEVIKWCQEKLKRLGEARRGVAGGGESIESDEIKSEIEATESIADEVREDNNIDDNEASLANQSLIEDKVLKQVKKQLNSEKYFIFLFLFYFISN